MLEQFFVPKRVKNLKKIYENLLFDFHFFMSSISLNSLFYFLSFVHFVFKLLHFVQNHLFSTFKQNSVLNLCSSVNKIFLNFFFLGLIARILLQLLPVHVNIVHSKHIRVFEHDVYKFRFSVFVDLL